MTKTAYQDLLAIAEKHLRSARACRAWPLVRPKSLRLFRLLGPRPTSIVELQAITGGAVNDVREDLEALAYALLVYAPLTVRLIRGRGFNKTRGGSVPHEYWLVPAR